MKKNGFVFNKYTLSLVIVLLVLSVDILMHKGMSRILLPATFIKNQPPQRLTRGDRPLVLTGKKWMKAVNNLERIEQLPQDIAGFEMDVYFDTAKNHLKVYHDSSEYNLLNIESILKVYKSRNLSCSIWLDFKNLSVFNQAQSLKYILYLRRQYDLKQRLIVESSFPELLVPFCDSGFFTSYYVPLFNPYLLSEKENIKLVETISANLQQYPTSALSGYYFQYPFLKKFFPAYPVLTWAARPDISVVSTVFNRKLQNDPQLKIILYP